MVAQQDNVIAQPAGRVSQIAVTALAAATIRVIAQAHVYSANSIISNNNHGQRTWYEEGPRRGGRFRVAAPVGWVAGAECPGSSRRRRRRGVEDSATATLRFIMGPDPRSASHPGPEG